MGELAHRVVGQAEPLPARRPGNIGTSSRTEFPDLLGELVRRGQLSYTRTSFAEGSTVYRGQHPFLRRRSANCTSAVRGSPSATTVEPD